MPLSAAQKRKLFNCIINAIKLNIIEEIQEAMRNMQQESRRYWIRPFLQSRSTTGDFYLAVPDMIREDPEYYFQTFRMTPATFEDLLALVGPNLHISENYVREPISAAERLQFTLYFLVSGDAQKSVAKNYRLGRSTVCQLINSTTRAIYDSLQQLVLPQRTTEKWETIAKEFELLWQFPNCVGAIDGKHFAIKAPSNSGSNFYNYKGFFSIVLLATCDACYNFTTSTIGSAGSESDAGIFGRSNLGKNLASGSMNLPNSRKLSNSTPSMPYVIIGDEAFPLQKHLMRPFPGDNLTIQQRIFNYRLSRARRVIENTFGILAVRWRMVAKTISMDYDNATEAIKACIVLHNYIRNKPGTKTLYIPRGFVDYYDPTTGELILGMWRNEVERGELQSLQRQGSNNFSKNAAAIRQDFKNYFNGEGQVPWQEEYVNAH